MGEADVDPRTLLAAERTLLAWIRTGLAMMGFGFVVARFGLFLRELAAAERLRAPRTPGLSLWLGTALIGLGVVVNVLAAVRHRRYLAALDAGTFRAAYRPAPGLAVALLLAVLGLGMAVYLLRIE